MSFTVGCNHTVAWIGLAFQCFKTKRESIKYYISVMFTAQIFFIIS